MRVLSWDEFNSCIQLISSKSKEENYKGVYGFPRGVLCLAVSLSHYLQIPFLTEPIAILTE